VAGLKSTLLIALILAVAVLSGTALLVHIRDVPKLSTIKKSFLSENLTILDRHGLVIDEIHKKDRVRRLNWVPLEQVPAPFIDAVLKSERWRLSRESITMQLAQSRFGPAIALEMVWSKKQILEAYINLSIYRGELQGIGAASQALFDRPPEKLTRSQSAVLASLIRSKDRPVHAVQSKACALLKSMNAAEDCALINKNHLDNIERGYRVRPFVRTAPHVAQLLGSLPDLRDGNVARSTLDRDLQWTALHALQKRAVNGAVVVIENRTGNVLAYVGNSGAGYEDLARDPRPAGTSLKPFLFTKALDERTITSTTPLEEKPEVVTMSEALRGNYKLAAIRALELVGMDVYVKALSSLGFSRLERAEFYGPSLALGSADVPLLELTNAYRALANKGVWSPVRFSPDSISEEAARRIFSEAAAFIVSDTLKEENTPWWAAVLCDQWCIGFSEKYTVGVLEGGRDVWQELMVLLHKNEPSQAPRVPRGVERLDGEWFLEGTEASAGDLRSRIAYPLDRSFIELNPEKPRENSRVFLQVVAPRHDQNLYLNGRRLGRAQSLLPWKPESGRHILELRDSTGQLLHKVRFQVKIL